MLLFHVRDAHLCMSYSLHNETLQTDNSDETGGCIYSMTQCCGNTMPDLSDMVPFHPGQVKFLCTCPWTSTNVLS